MEMKVVLVFLFSTIVATLMGKCRTRYLLVKIGNAEEKGKFHILLKMTLATQNWYAFVRLRNIHLTYSYPIQPNQTVPLTF